jgi:hypothetical protein
VAHAVAQNGVRTTPVASDYASILLGNAAGSGIDPSPGRPSRLPPLLLLRGRHPKLQQCSSLPKRARALVRHDRGLHQPAVGAPALCCGRARGEVPGGPRAAGGGGSQPAGEPAGGERCVSIDALCTVKVVEIEDFVGNGYPLASKKMRACYNQTLHTM